MRYRTERAKTKYTNAARNANLGVWSEAQSKEFLSMRCTQRSRSRLLEQSASTQLEGISYSTQHRHRREHISQSRAHRYYSSTRKFII